MDTGLLGTVPDPACEEPLTDGPMPSSLVETLEAPWVGRTKRPPPRQPGAVGHRALWPTQRGVAAHLPGTASQASLARHAAHKWRAAAWNKDYLCRPIGLKPKSLWMQSPWAVGLLGCRTATAQTRTQANTRCHDLGDQGLPRFHHRSLGHAGLWKNPAIPLGKRTITAIRDAP